MIFDSFVNLICNEIQVDSSIKLSILLHIGSNGVQNVLKILEDNYVSWFFTLVNDQHAKYPLIAC